MEFRVFRLAKKWHWIMLDDVPKTAWSESSKKVIGHSEEGYAQKWQSEAEVARIKATVSKDTVVKVILPERKGEA